MQDWKSWSRHDYIDGFTPLFLTCDPKTTANMISDIINNKSKNTNLYAGLFVTFMKGSPRDLIRIIHESRRFGLNGSIIFDYAHFGGEYMNILTASAFNDGSLHRTGFEEPKTNLRTCTKCKLDKKCRKCKRAEKKKQKETQKRAKKNKKI